MLLWLFLDTNVVQPVNVGGALAEGETSWDHFYLSEILNRIFRHSFRENQRWTLLQLVLMY